MLGFFLFIISAVVIPTLYWIVLKYREVYYWRNPSGEVIRGTHLQLFFPTLIALKENHLKPLGMYLLRFLPLPKLIITDTQTALRFMSKQHKYSRLKDFRLGYTFERLLGHSVGTASGADHKRMRGVFDGAYSVESVSHMVDAMEYDCITFLRETVEDRQGLLTIEDLTRLVFRFLMKYTYGRDITEDELKELFSLRRLVDSLIGDTFTNPLVTLPFYKYLPTKSNSDLDEFDRRWKVFNDSYKKRFDEDKLKDSTCVFYKLQQHLASNSAIIAEKEFLQTVEESSLANVDITCGALAWVLFHTALHTDVQRQMKDEVKTVTEEISSPMELSTLSKLDYLCNVVKESARMRPVMVISTPEYVTCPMNIGGFTTPAKFEASIDNSALNSDPTVWIDPETFNPNRFDDETPIMRRALCRFGIGTRRCLGYRVADTFIKVLLTILMKDYSITLETKVTGDDDSVPVLEYGPFVYPVVKFSIVRHEE